jgi:hypothetical protein
MKHDCEHKTKGKKCQKIASTSYNGKYYCYYHKLLVMAEEREHEITNAN